MQVVLFLSLIFLANILNGKFEIKLKAYIHILLILISFFANHYLKQVVHSQNTELSEHEQNQNDQMHLLFAQFKYLQSEQTKCEDSREQDRVQYDLKLDALSKYLDESREQNALEVEELKEECQKQKLMYLINTHFLRKQKKLKNFTPKKKIG